jgi:hypothetical protein
MSYTVQGNAGVPFASVSDGSNSVTADVNGNFTFKNESGSTTFTPSLSGYSFSPASQTINVAANYAGLNFTAANSSTAWSPVDSRQNPNSTLDVQDSQQYIVTPVDSRVKTAPPIAPLGWSGAFSIYWG